MDLNEVYIISGCRTGIGAFNGQFSKLSAVTLGTTVIKGCIERANIKPENVSEVILGHILTAGQGQNPARQAAINAGLPISVPAYTINMLCGSGLKAIHLGYQAIRNGDSSLVICGGQENMTMAQHSAFIRSGVKMGSLDLKDTLMLDGLTDPFNNVLMGVTAEFVAQKYNISREAQDQFSCNSQQKASKAVSKGHFSSQIVSVFQKKPPLELTKDEFIKHDVTIEKLAQLPTVFERNPSKNPSVTAGNSSGINDGAAAVTICSKKEMDRLKLQPLARIIGFSQCGCEPLEMGLGPIQAVENLLKSINWNKDEVDLYELNEAFASQSLVVIEKLGIDINKVNITGGAIALGHPIGASGARVLVTLIYNLQRLGLRKGVAALCIGGGMGIAIAIESC